jgi:Ni,Fe-hydrogenase III large subunit
MGTETAKNMIKMSLSSDKLISKVTKCGVLFSSEKMGPVGREARGKGCKGKLV